MSTVTIDDLKGIMRTCMGDDDSVNLDGDILDKPFSDLGYDSLALLETAARIKREFGVLIPDEEMGGIETPRILLDKVNAKLTPA
jgi:act minimal PKS acyl carrier protein